MPRYPLIQDLRFNMDTILNTYALTILSFGLTGGLLLLQLLIADMLGIYAKQPPGFPIEPDHNKPHFRAYRALANTNESVSIFIILVLFALLLSAPAAWLNGLSVMYVVGRFGHMCCYYANLKMLRSLFFGVGFLSLIGIFILGIIAWLI